MKILSLGLDNSSLNKNSFLAKRVIEYGGLVEKYKIIVPNRKEEKVELSEKVIVYGSGGINKFAQFFKIYKLAKRLLWEEKFNLITVQDQYYLALIGLFLSKKFRIGIEIQVHGFEKYYGLRKIIARYVLLRANAVRCVSQRLKSQLINEFNIKEELITVVPIYSELQITNYELRVKTNKDKFIFLTISRLVKVKNIEMQIEAMKEIIKKYPEIELWIIGDGSGREKLEIRSKKLGVADNIKFFGWQNNLNEYYKKADTFLLTSNAEGWGMAVIEVAAYGLPIIMTDVGCAGEVIKNEESGLIIPVGDKEKLVEAMLKIIKDEELRKKLGQNSKIAIKRLPQKEQILNLYKQSWRKAIL